MVLITAKSAKNTYRRSLPGEGELMVVGETSVALLDLSTMWTLLLRVLAWAGIFIAKIKLPKVSKQVKFFIFGYSQSNNLIFFTRS